MTTFRQINAQIPEDLARRVRVDIAKMGVSLSEYHRVVYESFLSKNLSTRQSHFREVRRKTVGRPVLEN